MQHFFWVGFLTNFGSFFFFFGGGGVVKIVGDWETSTGKMVSIFRPQDPHRSGGNLKAVAVATPNGELLMGDEVVSVNGL